MNNNEFDRRMAIALKSKNFSFETDSLSGNIVIAPRASKMNLSAIIDPEKNEVHYNIEFAEPVLNAYILTDELDDLRHFINLLAGED